MANSADNMLQELDTLLEWFQNIKKQTKYDDFSDVGVEVLSAFTASAVAAIERVTGSNSSYSAQAEVARAKCRHRYEEIPALAGVILALRNAVANGYLASAREMVHGELFDDFLEMAAYLLSEGYKDAAAVIGGGVLEVHLRKLCEKISIPLTFTALDGQIKSKRAEQLNDNLKAANLYGKLDHKGVTNWLDLRNKAAHAEYNEYSREQVDIALRSIRDFVARYPA